MTTTIRAHYDGKVIVPDETVNIPVGEQFTLELRSVSEVFPSPDPAERRRQLEEFFDLAVPGASIPLEAMDREYIYEDRV